MSVNRNKIYLAIGMVSFFITSQSIAQEAGDIDKKEMEQNINIANSSDVNPFLNLSSKMENITLEKKEKENELTLLNTELELQRREFQKEILPYQMEIQRLQLQKELDGIQNEINNSRNQINNTSNQNSSSNTPNVTLDEIRKRIDDVAKEMLDKKQARIDSLEKEKEEMTKRKNTFELNLISNNSKGTYAVIKNKEGESFTVSSKDSVNGWLVEGIDKTQEKVILRKNKQLEVLSFDKNLSLIDTKNLQQGVLSSRTETDDIEEPSEYSWNPEEQDIPRN